MSTYINTESATENYELQAGSGSVWKLSEKPDGSYYLKSWCSSFFPSIDNTVTLTTEGDYTTSSVSTFIDTYCTSGGRDFITDNHCTFTAPTNWGAMDVAIITDATEGTYSGSVVTTANEVTDGVDWTIRQIGNMNRTQIYCVTDNPDLEKDGDVPEKYEDLAGVKLNDIYYSNVRCVEDQERKISGIDVNCYKMQVVPMYLNVSDITQNYLSNIYGENIYLGEGSPMFETSANQVGSTLNVKIPVTNYAYEAGAVRVLISDDKFHEGTNRHGSKTWNSGKISIMIKETKIVEFNIDINKVGTYWIDIDVMTGNNIFVGNPEYKYVNS